MRPNRRGIDNKHNRPAAQIQQADRAFNWFELCAKRDRERAVTERKAELEALSPASREQLAERATPEQLAERDAQDKADLAAENAARRAKAKPSSFDLAIAREAADFLK